MNNHDGDGDDNGKDIHWDVVGEKGEHEREADKHIALYDGDIFALGRNRNFLHMSLKYNELGQ